MTTFLLVRHGETDAVGKSIMGWRPGWHLNAAGRAEVRVLAERLRKLPVRVVYTSPLERAIETAAEIARPHGLEPQPIAEFGEFHAGEWEGKTFAELADRDDWRSFNQFRSGTRAPGGELMIETQARMVRLLESLSKLHADEMAAVVSHGDPLRSVVAYYLGIPLDLMLRFEIQPASVSVLQLADWGARVLCINHKDQIPLEGN